jgi:hypothetical protein
VNKIFCRIKTFFRTLFQKENSPKLLSEKTELTYEESLFQKEIRQRDLAKKLINKEIDGIELTDEEVEEMTKYFEKDNNNLDREINKIKENIIRIKSKLNSSSN